MQTNIESIKIMTLPRLTLLVALALGAISNNTLQAADAPAARPEARPAPRTLTNRLDRMKAVGEELKLTPDQQEKLRPILQDESTKMVEIFRDTKLTREQKMAKLKESREAVREKVKPILTAEQLEKWDKLRQSRQTPTVQRARPAAK